jgi:hypothetical protein
VPGVPCGLLKQVHQHPAQAHRRPGVGAAAQLVEPGPGEGHRVHRVPALPVGLGRIAQRAVGRRGSGRDRVLAGEAVQHPGDLGGGHVRDQPQEAGAAAHGRPARAVLIDSVDLPQQGFPLVLQQRAQRLRLAAGQARRLAIGHDRNLRRHRAGCTRAGRAAPGAIRIGRSVAG